MKKYFPVIGMLVGILSFLIISTLFLYCGYILLECFPFLNNYQWSTTILLILIFEFLIAYVVLLLLGNEEIIGMKLKYILILINIVCFMLSGIYIVIYS